MIKVPILLGFDFEDPIGFVEIDETKLPPSADWHLGLGYMRKNIETHDYSLVCFSVVNDAKFKAYDPS